VKLHGSSCCVWRFGEERRESVVYGGRVSDATSGYGGCPLDGYPTRRSRRRRRASSPSPADAKPSDASAAPASVAIVDAHRSVGAALCATHSLGASMVTCTRSAAALERRSARAGTPASIVGSA